jgi:hypothetical protein
MLTLIIAAAATAGSWIATDVRRDVALCRYALASPDTTEYPRRMAEIRLKLKQTPAQARELEERCQMFVLGMGDLTLYLNAEPVSNPR